MTMLRSYFCASSYILRFYKNDFLAVFGMIIPRSRFLAAPQSTLRQQNLRGKFGAFLRRHAMLNSTVRGLNTSGIFHLRGIDLAT